MREVVSVVLVLLFVVGVRCGIKLLILALCGLGGLYMMHKLAQDFSKIQKQWGMGNRPFSGIFKRSTNEDWLKESFSNDTRLMSELVAHDPIGCARKYVCYIASKSLKKLTTSQKDVLGVLRSLAWLDSDGEWRRAQETGERRGRRGGCESAYLACGFTGAQLNRFFTLFDTE